MAKEVSKKDPRKEAIYIPPSERKPHAPENKYMSRKQYIESQRKVKEKNLLLAQRKREIEEEQAKEEEEEKKEAVDRILKKEVEEEKKEQPKPKGRPKKIE